MNIKKFNLWYLYINFRMINFLLVATIQKIKISGVKKIIAVSSALNLIVHFPPS